MRLVAGFASAGLGRASVRGAGAASEGEAAPSGVKVGTGFSGLWTGFVAVSECVGDETPLASSYSKSVDGDDASGLAGFVAGLAIFSGDFFGPGVGPGVGAPRGNSGPWGVGEGVGFGDLGASLAAASLGVAGEADGIGGTAGVGAGVEWMT